MDSRILQYMSRSLQIYLTLSSFPYLNYLSFPLWIHPFLCPYFSIWSSLHLPLTQETPDFFLFIVPFSETILSKYENHCKTLASMFLDFPSSSLFSTDIPVNSPCQLIHSYWRLRSKLLTSCGICIKLAKGDNDNLRTI